MPSPTERIPNDKENDYASYQSITADSAGGHRCHPLSHHPTAGAGCPCTGGQSQRQARRHRIAQRGGGGSNWDGTAEVFDPETFDVLARYNLVPDIEERFAEINDCLLYTSPSPRDQRGSRMPSSA